MHGDARPTPKVASRCSMPLAGLTRCWCTSWRRPLPAIAALWRTHPAMPMLLFGDDIDAGLRAAASMPVSTTSAGPIHPEELVAAVTLA